MTGTLQLLLTALVAMTPCAALLWLASALAAMARRDDLAWDRHMRLMALGLTAAAVWWPLELAAARSNFGEAEAVLGQLLLLALAIAIPTLAAITSTGDDLWHSGRRAGTAAATLLLAAVAIAIVSNATHSLGAALLRNGLGALALSGGLIALCISLNDERHKRWLRGGAVLGAAAALAFAPVPLREGSQAWAHPALLPTLALVLFAAALLGLVKLRQPTARISARLSAQALEPIEDALTRLPTRTHFETQLAAAVVRCDAGNTKLAMLFIDLDGFKPVNDTFGHSAGDRVLQSVGKRLKACARGSDVVARVGGDEFLILIGDAGTQDEVSVRARQIVDSLSEPIEIEDRQASISCSIGIAFYPDSGQHAKLISRADAAMYAAKRAGGAGFCFFAPSMEEDARERFDLLRDLRLALERKELELFYQPKIDAKSGKVTAAEALLRWQHPSRGMVPPSQFIPIAERFGLIHSIGHWVIEDACRQARVWLDHGVRMRVAINLSAVQMRQDDIVAQIEGALSRHGVDPSLLTCEITESVAMEDTKATQAAFRELGVAGIHLSIDDFGTGYSSLSYLRKLPAEELKIDRSFVMDIEHSADARAVVDAVVKLAHALGLKVVAEGIENERQQRILVDLGCDELQGFLFARPMTARALLLWALDDRSEEAAHFATSLFATSTQKPFGAAGRPHRISRAFAETVRSALLDERVH